MTLNPLTLFETVCVWIQLQDEVVIERSINWDLSVEWEDSESKK